MKLTQTEKEIINEVGKMKENEKMTIYKKKDDNLIAFIIKIEKQHIIKRGLDNDT